MATQTGECSIESIGREGDVVVRGHFRSLAALDVGFGDRDWAADFLCEALRKRAGVERDRQAVWQAIGAVMFATPRAEATSFEIYLETADVLEGLTEGSGDSYLLG